MTKKEFFENNVLSDEQLDDVAGGTYLESADDAERFKKIGVKVYDSKFLSVPVVQFDKLRSAFEQFGVRIKDNGGIVNANQYFIGDKEVTRDQAWEHINSQAK